MPETAFTNQCRAQARVEGAMMHHKQVQQERHDQLLLSLKLRFVVHASREAHLRDRHKKVGINMPFLQDSLVGLQNPKDMEDIDHAATWGICCTFTLALLIWLHIPAVQV